MSAILYPLYRSDLAAVSDASTYGLRVTCNSVTENLTTATLSSTLRYWNSGDGQTDADGGVGGRGDIAAIFQTMLRTHTQGASFAVVFSTGGVMTVTCSNTFQLVWTHAASTLSAPALGWAGTTLSATGLTAPSQAIGWFAPTTTGSARRPPSEDSRDKLRITVSGSKPAISGIQRVVRLSTGTVVRDLRYDLLVREEAMAEYATAAVPYGTAQHVWSRALSYGRPVRYYEDAATRTSSSYGLYMLRHEETPNGLDDIVSRDSRTKIRWSAQFPLRGYTAA